MTELRQDERGVDVTFASGRAERFDLLIGSDGIHSEVRGTVFGDDAARVHLDTYVAFWTAENHLGLADESVMYSEPGRSIGMRTILGGSKVMAFFTFRGGEPAYHHRDTETQKRITELRGAGMGWEAAPLLAQVRTADDFYFDACAQIKLDSWARGRVGLIGDAAYCASPLSGHGATIAMVGAYVLAGELATAGGDHTVAFARYRERLAPWIARIQDGAPANGRMMTPQTDLGIWFRSTLTRLTERLPAKALLVRDQVKMSNAFVLPRYA